MTCPTHGTDCPGHLHWEAVGAKLEEFNEALAYDQRAPQWGTLGSYPGPLYLEQFPREPAEDEKELHVYKQPEVRHPYTEAEVSGMMTDEDVAPIMAALNAAMAKRGGGRPQRAIVGVSAGPFNLDGSPVHLGVDLAPGGPTIMATDSGLVSWADWERPPFPWEEAAAAAVTRQEVRDVVAKHAPDYGEMVIQRHRDGNAYYTRGPGSAVWSPSRPMPVPELTPPPPCPTTAEVRRRWGVTIWEPVSWPGYPQDELLERLNLRWRYGHPPATPDRARRAGVRP